MKLRSLIVVATLVLSTFAARSQPEVASFRDGRFSAILAFTDKAEEFLSNWSQPPRPGYRPKLESSRKVALGRPITGFVFFGNCPRASTSNCRLTADLLVSRIDGVVVERRPDIPVWTRNQAPPENAIVLGEARFTLKFDRPEEVGRYRIDVQLQEESSGKSGALSWLLEVAE